MQPVHIKPFDWRAGDERDGYYINIFGHSTSSEAMLARIRYYPWMYIQLPPTTDESDLLINQLYESVRGIISHEIVEKKRIHGYNAGTIKLIKMSFNKMVTLYSCRKQVLLKNYECYEYSVNQISKFQAERDISYCEWLEFSKYRQVCDSTRKSLCRQEYHVSPSHIEKYTGPPLGVPLPSVFSFDGEMNATNITSMPKHFEPDDVTFCIGITFSKCGKVQKHAIVLEKCNQKTNAIIHVVKNEKEMADVLADLILELDPDVIIGHNIFKWDWPYLDQRLARGNHMWKPMSRYIGYTPEKFQEISWESSAYNEVEMGFPDCPGRIILDTWPFFQRSYKLPNYKLETIAQHFLGVGKNDVTPQEIFKLYSHHNPDDLGIIVDYCLQDTELPLRLFEKVKIWFELVETANVVRVSIMDLFTRGQGIRVFSQEYYNLYKKGFVIEPKKVDKEKYKGGFVFDGIPGLHYYVLCDDFASLYPSIMIAHNFCYTTLLRPDDPTPDEKCHVIEWDDENGVHQRHRWIKAEYYQGVLSAMEQELAVERKRLKKEMYPLELKSKDGSITEEEEVTLAVLDARQKGIKVSMNSIYGDKGTNMSKIPAIEIAKCTTFIGRDSIQKTAKEMPGVTVYGDTDSVMKAIPELAKYRKSIKVIGESMAEKASKMFLDPMKLELEKWYEVFFFIQKKMYAGFLGDSKIPEKKISDLTEKELDKRFLCRGIPIARRDNCNFLRGLYKKVLYMIMLGKGREDILSHIESQVRFLIARQVPFDDLVIIKKMGKNYKMESNPLSMFNTYLKKRGDIVEAGDRIEYVFVETDPVKKPLQGDKMQSPKFFKIDENIIDVDYYLTNVVATPINKILTIRFPEVPDTYIEKAMFRNIIDRRLYLRDVEKGVTLKHVQLLSLNGGTI